MRSILIIVPEEGLLFESAGIADIFHEANLALGEDSPHPRYRLTLATSLRDRVVHGRSGLNLLADACLGDLSPAEERDTIIATGKGVAEDEQDAVADWLKMAAPHARRTVSVCAGAFLLARAGLLDGRRATTHWKAAAEFRRRYPAVRLEEDAIYVQDGPIWTSAGASSGFDLALALVEADHGSAVARQVAQQLVMFLRRPGGQSQFSRVLELEAVSEGPIRNVQAWAIDHLDQDLSVEALADKAAMSPRNFARVFLRETGTTPARFVELVRMDAARQRLERGRESLDEIAAACGLGSGLNLRRAFERRLGIAPSDYRTRFGSI